MPDLTLSSDLDDFLSSANDAAARTALGLGTGDSPQFTAINLGNASDTTISRSAAGKIAVEAKAVPLMDGVVDLVIAGPTSTRTMTVPDANFTAARIDAANTFTGASTAAAWVLTSPTITTSIVPTSNDGAALGSSSNSFSDLFLASGAVLNFANGNVVATHSSGILTVGTGELRITTPGTNAASVPTLGSSSTLTNKAITKRVITTTDDATAVIDVAVTDVYELSAIANATAFSTTGSPTDGQAILIRFKDAGVAKALTWDAIFVAIGVTLPTTTTAGKWTYVGAAYNSGAAKFHVTGVTTES